MSEPQLTASLWMTLVAVWASSFVGSAHCLGMCGPIAIGVSRGWPQALAYNTARGFTYTIIGFLFGWAGESLLAFNSRGFQYFSTGIMVLLILIVSWRIATGRPFEVHLPSFWLRHHRRVFKKTIHADFLGANGKSFAVGLLTAALPCGWLYTFVILAAASGSAERGGLILAAFWLGTLPVMAAAPLLTNRILRPLQSKSPVWTGVLIASTSLFAIWIKWSTEIISSCH